MERFFAHEREEEEAHLVNVSSRILQLQSMRGFVLGFFMKLLEEYSSCLFQIHLLICPRAVVRVTLKAGFVPQYRVDDSCFAKSITFSFPSVPEYSSAHRSEVPHCFLPKLLFLLKNSCQM